MCIRDSLYTQITGSVGLAGYMTEVMPSGLAEYNAEVTQMIKDAGVMWNGVPAVKSGAIIIGILLGTMTVFIIDKQLHKVAITAVVGYVLACFGFIHSAGPVSYTHLSVSREQILTGSITGRISA